MATEDRTAERRIAGKIQAGDFDAEVEAWVRRFAKKAMATARRWGHHAEDAEDFVQDFWVLLLRNRLKTYSPDHSLFSYCFTMFMNEFHRKGLDRAQDLRNTEPIDPAPRADGTYAFSTVLISIEPSTEQAMISEEERLTLEQALNALEPDDRQLMMERVLEERPYAEIAKRLGLSQGTVRVRFHRALRKLHRTAAISGIAGNR